jgi:hypothetical protein
MRNRRAGWLTTVITALVAGLGVSAFALPAAASPAPGPTGERLVGGSGPNGGTVLEPVYNDITGAISYVSTPRGTPNPVNSNPTASAPFYLPVYPTSSQVPQEFTPNCQDTSLALNTVENCPDHGPAVAAAVQAIASTFTAPFTDVYAGGVAGHDHLMGGPGTQKNGGDFNVAWVPTLVIFTNAAAANVHVTTLAQITADVNATPPDAILVPLNGSDGTPNLTFHCSVVPAAVYNNGTPFTG